MTLLDRFGLEGKAALVVGGGYGIGRETSLLLAQAGARVAVADLDPVRAANVADEVGGVAVVGDVTDPAGARKVVDDATRGSVASTGSRTSSVWRRSSRTSSPSTPRSGSTTSTSTSSTTST